MNIKILLMVLILILVLVAVIWLYFVHRVDRICRSIFGGVEKFEHS